MYTSLKLGFMLELSKYSSVKRGREVFVSFFVHRDFINNLNKEEVVKLMHEKVKGELVRFLLGNYGNFDTFAYQCAKAYKQKYGNAKLIFVTPYLDTKYLNHCEVELFDEVVYPPLENVPLKCAILKRNEWMVAKSDFLIFYVNVGFGGAYQALEQAKRSGKEHINLGALGQL